MDRTLLERKALAELREIASTLELRGYQRMKKADLVDLIMNSAGDAAPNGGESTGSTGDGRATSGATEARTARTRPGDSGPGSDTDAEPSPTERDRRDPQGRDATAADRTAGSSEGRHDDERNRSDRGRDDRDDDDRDDDGGSTGSDADRVRARRRDDREDGSEDDRQRTRARHRDDREGDGQRQRDEAKEDREGRDRDGKEREDKDGRDQGREREDKDGRDQGKEREDKDGRDQGARGQGDGQGGRGQGDGGQGDGRNRSKRDRRRKGRGGGGQQQQQEDLSDAEVREGVLDLLPEGYGFLRCTGYLSGNKDVYVSQSFVRRFGLRRGDLVSGPIRRNKNNDKFPALARVDTVEGQKVADLPQKRIEFSDLTPLFPDERLRLEVEEKSPISMRIVDMMAPVGKGQRGLIVSPPKAGKTTILKQLAHAMEVNNPEVHLMVLLVDERPEEVTDFARSTSGEVVASTFDRPADDHTQAAELTIERAKRLVENGRDVVILLDSITRLGRAYNLAAPASGRILSGGIDSAALYPPKRFFGAARNIEQGGSLTIIATALIETGSKMDEVIFEEFKGTGNMELRLDRKMEQKRIFPAIDIQASGTRREELLLETGELDTVWKLRRLLATMDSDAALQLLIDKLRATQSNTQFLQMIARSSLQ